MTVGLQLERVRGGQLEARKRVYQDQIASLKKELAKLQQQHKARGAENTERVRFKQQFYKAEEVESYYCPIYCRSLHKAIASKTRWYLMLWCSPTTPSSPLKDSPIPWTAWRCLTALPSTGSPRTESTSTVPDPPPGHAAGGGKVVFAEGGGHQPGGGQCQG